MKPNAPDVLSFIFGRRSIRLYAPGEINTETVTELLKASMAAPSAMTKDPWRFIVVRRRSLLAEMAAALPGGKMLGTATLTIVVCGDLDAAFENHLGYLLQDCSAAIENLLLAAHGRGLGGCWVGIHPSENSVGFIRTLLSLPTRIVPVAAIALGPPGEQLEPRTRYQPQHVYFEQWGSRAAQPS